MANDELRSDEAQGARAPRADAPTAGDDRPTEASGLADVKSLGLRNDTPSEVVKAIVGAVQKRPERNPKEVRLALSSFNLQSLLKPDATVHSLATGLNDLARSGKWPRLVPKDE